MFKKKNSCLFRDIFFAEGPSGNSIYKTPFLDNNFLNLFNT